MPVILFTNYRNIEDKTAAKHTESCLELKHFYSLSKEALHHSSSSAVWASLQTHMLCICLGIFLHFLYVSQQHKDLHGKENCQVCLLFSLTHRGLCSRDISWLQQEREGLRWEGSTSPGTLGWKTLFRSKEEALEWVFCGRGGGVGGSSPLFMVSSMEVLE